MGVKKDIGKFSLSYTYGSINVFLNVGLEKTISKGSIIRFFFLVHSYASPFSLVAEGDGVAMRQGPLG